MNLSAYRIWITGASSGIGRALAMQALAAGAQVAVSGRREEQLRSIAENQARLFVVPFDVRDEAAAIAAANRIDAEWGGLDWAILNAGDCEYLDPQQWDSPLIRRVMEVNFFGCLHCAQAALPLLTRARKRGLLAAISSAAAYCPLPRAAAYGASKSAVTHFIRGLEPHFPQMDFCLAHPGFVRTPLTARNDFPMPLLMEADDAASIILRGLQRRQSEIAFPRRLIIALKMLAAMPTRLRRRVWARMMQT